MSRAAEIIRLKETLWAQRTNFDTTYQEVVDNIDPHHRDIIKSITKGQKKNQLQFDGTALYASQIFGDFYQGSVFNQGTKWFSVRHENKAINEKPENADWYDTIRDIALQALRQFYGPGGQAIGAWALFGNGPVLIEEVPIAQRRPYQARIKYTSIPWGQYGMIEGLDGSIDGFIRSLQLPAHLIVKRFGDKVSDDIAKAADKEPLKEFEILHSILPRDFQAYSKSTIKTAKDMQFESCWTEVLKKQTLEESGYRKFPVAVARYKQISGEVYARGLGEVALPDAKVLNRMDEMDLLQAGRELDPPLLVRGHSLVSRVINQQAKGKTLVKDINNSVKPLIDGSNYPRFEATQERKTKQIMRVFHVDEILNLLSHESPQLTAFEVNARLTLLQQILGPVFGQNDMSFFNPVIDITLDILAHSVGDDGQAMLPQAPDEVANAAKGAFNFIFEGPLARAQRNQELVSIQQSVADTGQIAQFYPQVVKQVDWSKLNRAAWEIRGTQQYLLSEEDFTAAVNEQTKQDNAAKAVGMLGGGAEALGKVAPFIKASREAAGPGGQAAA